MGNPWAARDASFLIQDTVAPLPRPEVIARGLVRWLKSRGVESIAIVADEGDFPRANAVAILKSAQDAGMRVTVQETLAKDTKDFAETFHLRPKPIGAHAFGKPGKAGDVDEISLSVLSPGTGAALPLAAGFLSSRSISTKARSPAVICRWPG